MIETILTLNAGSSSVKFQLFDKQTSLPLVAHGNVANIGSQAVFNATFDQTCETTTLPLATGATHENAVRQILDWVHGHESGWHIVAVAHRIVHGGTEFTGPVRST